jgi:hypothetical protein
MASAILSHLGDRELTGFKNEGTELRSFVFELRYLRPLRYLYLQDVQAAAPKTSRLAATTGDAPISSP